MVKNKKIANDVKKSINKIKNKINQDKIVNIDDLELLISSTEDLINDYFATISDLEEVNSILVKYEKLFDMLAKISVATDKDIKILDTTINSLNKITKNIE